MTNIQQVDAIAEKLRQEPYNLLTNDCITKSIRLKKACRALGIKVRVVVCIGTTRARLFDHWLTIPVIHGWGEVDGHRIETSRPLGNKAIWEIVPMNIKPVIAVRF